MKKHISKSYSDVFGLCAGFTLCYVYGAIPRASQSPQSPRAVDDHAAIQLRLHVIAVSGKDASKPRD